MLTFQSNDFQKVHKQYAHRCAAVDVQPTLSHLECCSARHAEQCDDRW